MNTSSGSRSPRNSIIWRALIALFCIQTAPALPSAARLDRRTWRRLASTRVPVRRIISGVTLTARGAPSSRRRRFRVGTTISPYSPCSFSTRCSQSRQSTRRISCLAAWNASRVSRCTCRLSPPDSTAPSVALPLWLADSNAPYWAGDIAPVWLSAPMIAIRGERTSEAFGEAMIGTISSCPIFAGFMLPPPAPVLADGVPDASATSSW
jgi:hypothetical protein